ncbi:MAG: hypothetical protein C0475_06485 [Planctomyces sp.]|nr:hypothetical protein [Planctomyces sp.]
MSQPHQCPTSLKEGKPAEMVLPLLERVGTTGSAYWRGLDQLGGSPEAAAQAQREFGPEAGELLSGSRRGFLKIMGAGLALAGAAAMPACRRPDHKILAYSRSIPEDVVPGRPSFYATSMPTAFGGAEGLLIESHEGRPTKIEGNPVHPHSQGKTSAWAQAEILRLYDPDRTKEPRRIRDGAPVSATWDDFAAWSARHFAAYDATQGQGLAILADQHASVARRHVRQALLRRWPRARWVAYSPVISDAARQGLRAALGANATERFDLTKAAVIVSFDRDLLQHDAQAMASARQWGAARGVLRAGDPFNRLYALESRLSVTGMSADHRVRLAPSGVSRLAALVGIAALERLASPGTASLLAALQRRGFAPADARESALVSAIASDLTDQANRGRSLVVAGPSQPAWVHALAAALNGALGSVGAAVVYAPEFDSAEVRGIDALGELGRAMAAGEVSTLVCLGCNPVYDAPADLGIAQALAKVPERVSLQLEDNETHAAATWQLNAAHFLESWGDTVATDGTVAPIQPLVAPLYGGRSDLECLALVAGLELTSGYDLVRQAWVGLSRQPEGPAFEALWERALHNGVSPVAHAAEPGQWLAPDPARAAQALTASATPATPSAEALEAVFVPSMVLDGRYNNHPWLQELPDPASKVVWDNCAYLSPATAQRLGLTQSAQTDEIPTGKMATLTLGGRSVSIVAWALPGVPDNTVILPLGYGRARVGVVGVGTGFDTYKVRLSTGLFAAPGATLTPAGQSPRTYPVSTTQTYGAYIENRGIYREVDLPSWRQFGDQPPDPARVDSYGRPQPLNFAERLEYSEFNHQPDTLGLYPNPYTVPGGQTSASARRPNPDGKAAYQRRIQLGMTIDMSACTGCGVCTVACQAENNIPVVGKTEVRKGREMHWIRIDRYFRGSDPNEPEGYALQPVACVHCENAPCETVCPVNATVHGPEGHNYMVYNRCIGTRYCANNCPYKVRRFNFFDYGVTKFNGNYFGRSVLESVIPGERLENQHAVNPNLIPPRLRQKLDEISRMQKNPNVTVRSRGVMEKCTYCIQRTNEAKIDTKVRALDAAKRAGQTDPAPWRPSDGWADGAVQSACQQACPTGAIVFGDILDTQTPYADPAYAGGSRVGSRVHNLRTNNRSYLVLGYLNTRPRTSHLVRVNNPHPDLVSAQRKAKWANPFGHGHGDGHGDGHDHDGRGGSHSPPAHGAAPRPGSGGGLVSLTVLGSPVAAPAGALA